MSGNSLGGDPNPERYRMLLDQFAALTDPTDRAAPPSPEAGERDEGQADPVQAPAPPAPAGPATPPAGAT